MTKSEKLACLLNFLEMGKKDYAFIVSHPCIYGYRASLDFLLHYTLCGCSEFTNSSKIIILPLAKLYKKVPRSSFLVRGYCVTRVLDDTVVEKIWILECGYQSESACLPLYAMAICCAYG